ncbi:hypothetical protein AM493_03490 [Flavobacterium akiainvivens]|uniref:DUF5362 domain-containing protein n=1 Tax=Flavobacterium akiainvivens TaxID=1202724 RepID=A0A0M9VH54_9FLAO|nr:DUF5362 family protein [Flavobacterium akiainvivens]KOS05202.1 hypothetical protein AM493_03490 [Flavobacterium akiainvivens]SFQ50671.1 hypothetical protein SAMN05444144_106106 [Flavobacterium akiainvivens]
MDYKSPFESEQSSQFDNFELHVNAEAQSFLRETAKWATFLSILGFIGLGFMLLGGIFMMALGSSLATAGSPMSGVVVGLIYLIMAGLYFFPILYLNRFASKIKDALNSNRTDILTEAFGNLKSHYKFVGIATIVGIALFILFFIIGIVAAMGAAAGAY